MSAEAMVNATTGYLGEGELLYIATDEDHPDFFEPFRERCVCFLHACAYKRGQARRTPNRNQGEPPYL